MKLASTIGILPQARFITRIVRLKEAETSMLDEVTSTKPGKIPFLVSFYTTNPAWTNNFYKKAFDKLFKAKTFFVAAGVATEVLQQNRFDAAVNNFLRNNPRP